jgi:hypothetical protein
VVVRDIQEARRQETVAVTEDAEQRSGITLASADIDDLELVLRLVA